MDVSRPTPRLARRAVLRASAMGGLALLGLPLLAACGGSATATTTANTGSSAAAASAAPSTSAAAATTASAASATATTSATTAAAASSSGSATATAAANAAPSGAVTTMTFLHFFTGVLWTGGFEHLVDQFQKENPSIKWNGIAVPYNQMEPKLITLAAGGQPPDGTSLDNTEIDDVAIRGLLKDLDPYVAADKSVNLDDFYKARLDEQRWQGKLYGLPIDMGSSAIYYNKDMFDKAGLQYPNPKWTYDDILSLATKLTIDQSGKHPNEAGFDVEHVKQWGFQYDNSVYRFYNMYTGYNGAQYFDNPLTKTEINTPNGIASLQWFADLTTKHKVAPSPAQTTAMSAGGVYPFASGLYAMQFAWIGLIAYLHVPDVKVTNWDVINLPETSTAAQEVGGQGFVVINGAKQPDAGWAWTKYMVGDEAQKYLGVNGVWFPGRKSMAQYGWPTDHKPANFIPAFYDQVDKHGLDDWWFVPGWPKWQQAMTNGLDPLWTGQSDAKTVAAAVQQQLDPQVANWKSNVTQ